MKKGMPKLDLSHAIALIIATPPTAPTAPIRFFTTSANSWKTNVFSRGACIVTLGFSRSWKLSLVGPFKHFVYYWSSNSFWNQYPYSFTTFIVIAWYDTKFFYCNCVSILWQWSVNWYKNKKETTIYKQRDNTKTIQKQNTK
jgi:hypothetical protein